MTAPDGDAAQLWPPGVVDALTDVSGEALAETTHRPVVIGLCGAQGSGKSTLARQARTALGKQGVRAAALSLDDLYLTQAERRALAGTVHPLFVTRGVPATHDVSLGLAILDALGRGEPAMLPSFDKAQDDRAPDCQWPAAPSHCDVLIFEGWCIGARPQCEHALVAPVNDLERVEDGEGVWRRFANDALGDDYQRLFGRLDRLVLLAAPGFDVVASWRWEQEQAAMRTRGRAKPVMDRADIERFVAHYERLTGHILAEMPDRADLTVRLGADRTVLGITRR